MNRALARVPLSRLALTAGLLRLQTAEAIAHLHEQAARMHAGLSPDPLSQPPPDAAGEGVGG